MATKKTTSKKAEPKDKKGESLKERFSKAPDTEYKLQQIENHLLGLWPQYQKFLLDTCLAKIPEKERAYQEQQRQQEAMDSVLVIIQDWQPKQLYAAAKMLRTFKVAD